MTALDRSITGLLALARTPPAPGELPPLDAARSDVVAVRAMAQAGVPQEAIHDAMRLDMQPTGALEIVRRWATRDAGTLILAGGTGTGKSVAVAWLLAERWRSGRACGRWIACTGLDGVSRFDSDEWLAEHSEPRVLVLDELGGELGDSDQAGLLVAALLARRHERRLLTVLTSNMRTEQEPGDGPTIEQRLGARVLSRLRQGGEVHACVGQDLREVMPRAEAPERAVRGQRIIELFERLDSARCLPREGTDAHEDLRLAARELWGLLLAGRLACRDRSDHRRISAEFRAEVERLADAAERARSEWEAVAARLRRGDVPKAPDHVGDVTLAGTLLEQERVA